MSFVNKIIIYLRIDKIIDSINKWRIDSRNIQIKNSVVKTKDVANYAKSEGLDKVAGYLKQKAKIREESLK